LHNHHSVVSALKPRNIEQLAAVLAVIRPAKRYLLGADWQMIMKEVWTKPTDGQYYFKKAHAIAYAVSIVVQLNLFCEQAESNGA
jgi:DNA polymerase III alpha subunit